MELVRLATADGPMDAIFCDARPAYHPAAAQAAWGRTLDWFGRHLGEAR